MQEYRDWRSTYSTFREYPYSAIGPSFLCSDRLTQSLDMTMGSDMFAGGRISIDTERSLAGEFDGMKQDLDLSEMTCQ